MHMHTDRVSEEDACSACVSRTHARVHDSSLNFRSLKEYVCNDRRRLSCNIDRFLLSSSGQAMILLMRLEKNRTHTLTTSTCRCPSSEFNQSEKAERKEIIRQQSEKVEKERSQSQTNH